LGKYLNHQRLQRYFNEHRAHFDGGNRDVAHILWKITPEMTLEQRQALMQAASDLRQQIEEGEISFADAARKHSAGPSAANGGELGSIDRDGPMTEIFSEVAFELEPGEVSRPVLDTFGLHLIRCLHAEPGQRQFKEVRAQVERAARAELFALLARRGKKNAEIELMGVIKVANNGPLGSGE
jgi:parvulin-like peptidyl-prolyl isomerase